MIKASADGSSKVLFWNIWGHRNPRELERFLSLHSEATDVMCLTEVTDVPVDSLRDVPTTLVFGTRVDENPQHVDGFNKLSTLLSGSHHLLYSSATRATWTCERTGVRFQNVGFGSTLVIHNRVTVVAEGALFVCQNIDGIHPRALQWVVYERSGQRYLVAHLHGVWLKENTKGDHQVRMLQSLDVRSYLQALGRKYTVDKIVFGGDLNLDRETKALQILCNGLNNDSFQLRNMIDEHNIKGTRTAAYRKFNEPGESMYADYVLVSPDVQVKSFSVVTDEQASDHAPLLIEFS